MDIYSDDGGGGLMNSAYIDGGIFWMGITFVWDI